MGRLKEYGIMTPICVTLQELINLIVGFNLNLSVRAKHVCDITMLNIHIFMSHFKEWLWRVGFSQLEQFPQEITKIVTLKTLWKRARAQ